MKNLSKQEKQIFDAIDDDVAASKWQDWKWQIKHCVHDLERFEELLGVELDQEMRNSFKATVKKFPMSVTPYYLSLIDPENLKYDPIFMQSFPSQLELNVEDYEMNDPLHEEVDSPVKGITHRYPDRVLFLISNMCAMYCRHCTRKRKVGDRDSIPGREQIDMGLDYIRKTPQVRDVLVSGGDPFLLSTSYLDWILTELENIEHVEVIRIGTRTPVVLPQRITDELVEMLRKHKTVWINTHFNHPCEVTKTSQRALAKLADIGIPLGNQTVLLAGVNDCPRIMKALVHKLVANRVRPYYMFQCDLSEGLSHFRTPLGKGVEILESLIGHTSGFCVPKYVIDAPGGGGKIPITPNYLISWSTNKVILRNYEGVITTYKEPDSYKPYFCDRDCENCNLQLKLGEAQEHMETIGFEKLLSDENDTISLVPAGNERMNRRD